MKRVVLISGKQGSGKTTLSRNLTAFLAGDGLNPIGIKFADVLYELHDNIWKTMNKYGRQLNAKKDGPLLQLLGTEWGRNTLGENIWVEIAKYRAAEALKDPRAVVIIDDCRFPNELSAFPEAFRVRLESPAAVRRERCEAWRDNETHQSETALDSSTDFDRYYQTDKVDSETIAIDILNQIVFLHKD
jgi:Mrp family chromosome partitioning ATPase